MGPSLFLAHDMGTLVVSVDAMNKVKSLEFSKNIDSIFHPSNSTKGDASKNYCGKFTTSKLFYGASAFNRHVSE